MPIFFRVGVLRRGFRVTEPPARAAEDQISDGIGVVVERFYIVDSLFGKKRVDLLLRLPPEIVIAF